MTSTAGPHRSPYPGLRSFLREETDLFFGRDGTVHDMLRRLGASRFLAVLGASGSGKSSLVRTGMLDGLDLGLIAQAGSWWRVIDIRPGGDPMRALAVALCPPDAPEGEVAQMRAFLLGGPRALVEWARGAERLGAERPGAGRLGQGENLLLLVDQFEELFRYRGYDGHQEAEAFVALLLESARNRDVPIYVTLTMRSEYLGACALFDGLAEAMNAGQYLTPRMTRDQCRAAIEGPAAVSGFQLEPALAGAVLNDLGRFAPWEGTGTETGGEADLRSLLDVIGRRADQLPLLQHALNRLWLLATERAGATGAAPVLTLDDYHRIGGLRGAIDQHAGVILDTLSAPARAAVPALFRALVTGATVAEAVRRPTLLADLPAITGHAPEAIAEAVEAFRAPGRSFLTPPSPSALGPGSVIDISHESLIRQWTALSGWLQDEARDAVSIRRLDEAATRDAEGSGELLTGRDLAPLATWRRESRLPEDWARRYVAQPARAFDFLDRSVRAAGRSRRTRRVWAAGGVVALLAMALMGTVTLVARKTVAVIQEYNTQLIDDNALAKAENDRLLSESAALAGMVADVREQIATLGAQQADATESLAALVSDRAKLESELGTYKDFIQDSADAAIATEFWGGRRGPAADLLASVMALPDDVTAPFATTALWSATLDRALGRSTPVGDLTPALRLGAGRLLTFAAAVNRDTAGDSAFALLIDPGTSNGYAVVDSRTGLVAARFAVPTDRAQEIRRYALSMTGTEALLEDAEGRLLRWSKGHDRARRVLDRIWLRDTEDPTGPDRRIVDVIFDEASGRIALEYWQFGAAFFTVLPNGGSTDAKVWRVAHLEQALQSPDLTGGVAPVQPLGLSLSDDVPNSTLRLAALTDGGLTILAWPEGKANVLARFDLETGAGQVLHGTGTFERVIQTGDPGLLNVGLQVSAKDCVASAAVLTAAAPPRLLWDAANCIATFDLAARGFVGPGLVVPMGAWTDGVLLTRDPLPTDRPPVLGGPYDAASGFRLPRLEIARDSVDAAAPAGDVARLDGWGKGISLIAPEVQQLGTGVTLWDRNGSDLTAVDVGAFPTDLTGPSAGSLLPRHGLLSAQEEVIDGQLAEDDSFTVDPAGRFALLSNGSGGLKRYTKGEGARLDPVTVVPDGSCDASGDQPGLGLLYALSKDGSWHLVNLPDDQGVGLLRLAPAAAAPVTTDLRADLLCLDVTQAESLLARDLERDTFAFKDPAGRRITVWTLLSADSKEDPLTLTFTLPDGETASRAAFTGVGDLVVLTSTGKLLVRPLSTAAARREKPYLLPLAPLPTANRIDARGDVLVLSARGDAFDPPASVTPALAWSMVALVRLGDDGAGALAASLTHAGAIPYDAAEAAALLPALTEGGIEMMQPDGTYLRLRLPAAPDPAGLGDEVRSFGNPMAIGDAGMAARHAPVALLMSLTAKDASADLLSSALTCAAHVELRLRKPQSASLRTVPPGLAECTRPQDAALLAEIDQMQAQGIPDASLSLSGPESALLARAAAGDGPALYALASGLVTADPGAPDAGSLPLRGLALLAGETLGNRLSDAGQSWDPSAGLTGDALAQMGLARQALAAGDAAAAYRHASIALAIYGKAGLPGYADAAQSLRLAAAQGLSAADRTAALRDLAAFVPAPPPPPDPATGLEADLAAMDTLLARSGEADALALLRLSRLMEAVVAAKDAVRPALVARTARFAADVTDWPPGAAGADLARVLHALRDALPPADAALALKLDIAVVALYEGADTPLPVFAPDELALYVQSLTRVLAANPADLVPLAGALRFRAAGLGWDILDMPSGQAITPLDLVAARKALAQRLPDTEGAAFVVAAAPFWEGVVLNNTPDAPDDREALARREAFVALLTLHKDGKLQDFDERSLLAAAANWSIDLVLPEMLDAEFDDLQAVSILSAEVIIETEQRASPSPLWSGPVNGRAFFISTFANILRNVSSEPAFDAPDDANLARMRRTVKISAQWPTLIRKGEVDQIWDSDLDNKDRVSVANGYVIAYLAGRQRAVGTGAPSDCATRASSPFDPFRSAPSVLFDTLMADQGAVASCRTALAKAPTDAALKFLLGRAIWAEDAQTNRPDSPMVKTCFLAAAEDGNIAALNALAQALPDAELEFWQAYHDQVLLSSFHLAHAALDRPDLSLAEKAALLTLAREAADLGSPEANLILGRIEADPVERAYRMEVSSRLFRLSDHPQDFDAHVNAAALAEEAVQGLSEPDADYLFQRLAVWTAPQAMALKDQLRALYPEVDKTCR